MKDSSFDVPYTTQTRLDALDTQGIGEFKNGNIYHAEQLFSKAIFLSPDDPGSWFNMGYLYFSQKQYPIALAIFSRLADDHAYTKKDVKFSYVYGDTLCMNHMPSRGVQVLRDSLPYIQSDTERLSTINVIKSCLRKVGD